MPVDSCAPACATARPNGGRCPADDRDRCFVMVIRQRSGDVRLPPAPASMAFCRSRISDETTRTLKSRLSRLDAVPHVGRDRATRSLPGWPRRPPAPARARRADRRAPRRRSRPRSADTAGWRPPAARRARARPRCRRARPRRRSRARRAPSASDRDARRGRRAGCARATGRRGCVAASVVATGPARRPAGEERADDQRRPRPQASASRPGDSTNHDIQPRARRPRFGSSRAHTVRSNAVGELRPRRRSRRRPRARAAAAVARRGTAPHAVEVRGGPRFFAGVQSRRSSEESSSSSVRCWSWSWFTLSFRLRSGRCPRSMSDESGGRTSGSSACASSCTARKMLCLVAFVLSPSDRLISSIELPLEVAQHERGPFHLAERRHRVVDARPAPRCSASAAPAVRAASRVDGLAGAELLEVGGVVRRFPMRPRTNQVDRAVHRDAVQPGAEVRPRLESAQLLVGLQKRLLHHVLRVRRVAGHPMRQPEDSPAVALDERPESFAISVAASATAAASVCGIRLLRRGLRFAVR